MPHAVLQKVWAASGGQCGKYLANGVERYSPAVRAELVAMSAASIDRYLKGAKATDQIKGASTTKPSLC